MHGRSLMPNPSNNQPNRLIPDIANSPIKNPKQYTRQPALKVRIPRKSIFCEDFPLPQKKIPPSTKSPHSSTTSPSQRFSGHRPSTSVAPQLLCAQSRVCKILSPQKPPIHLEMPHGKAMLNHKSQVSAANWTPVTSPLPSCLEILLKFRMTPWIRIKKHYAPRHAIL